MCPSVSGTKVLKHSVCDSPYSISVKSYGTFLKRIKKIWSDHKNIALEKKYLEMKNLQTSFYFLYVKLQWATKVVETVD